VAPERADVNRSADCFAWQASDCSVALLTLGLPQNSEPKGTASDQRTLATNWAFTKLAQLCWRTTGLGNHRRSSGFPMPV